MSKTSSMARLAKLLVLVQVLANAACEPPVEPLPEMKGTWDYVASFVTATTVVDSVTCGIAGVAITVGEAISSGNVWGGTC